MEETTLSTSRKSKPSEKTATSKTSKTKTASSKTEASASGSSRSKSSTTKSKASFSDISTEQRNRMIETAAYFIAEQNGFCSNPVEDWLTAESQINQQLR